MQLQYDIPCKRHRQHLGTCQQTVNTGVFMTALISFVILRICLRPQRLESLLVVILADTAVIVVTLCNSSCLAGQLPGE